jgi:hypothetical protein
VIAAVILDLACFEKKWPDEPICVIYTICYWIDLWSSLQANECSRDQLRWLAKLVERVAAEVFGARGSCASWTQD